MIGKYFCRKAEDEIIDGDRFDTDVSSAGIELRESSIGIIQ
jgi:hypothetical protein